MLTCHAATVDNEQLMEMEKSLQFPEISIETLPESSSLAAASTRSLNASNIALAAQNIERDAASIAMIPARDLLMGIGASFNAEDNQHTGILSGQYSLLPEGGGSCS